MLRLTARPSPAARSICPTLNADCTSGLWRTACATLVATARVTRVSSGGASSARMTKKHSSRFTASASPLRYTTTGHIQFPAVSAPITAATTHWLELTCHGTGCRSAATTSVSAPPATEPATMAAVTLGSFMVGYRIGPLHAKPVHPPPLPDPSSGDLPAAGYAFQVLTPRIGNNETVSPIKVDII